MIRTNRTTAFLAAAVIFIVLIASLGYSNRDSWEFSSSHSGVEVIDDDLNITPIPVDTPADKKPSEAEKVPAAKVSKPAAKPTETTENEDDLDEGYDEEDLLDDEDSIAEPTNDSSANKPTETESSVSDDEQAFKLLSDIHKDIVKPTSTKYQPYGALSWEFKQDYKPKFENLMGDDICIIDIDNRPFNETGQVFSDSMSWDDTAHLHGLSLGVLNHWLYAKLHGYKYYFVTFDTPEDRRSSWEKPSIISKLLKKHKTCVYLDSDAIFYHMDLPIEWLMNYWQIDPKQHSFALSWDPKFEHNKDQFGQLYFNTGFIIMQNSKKTFDILKDWDECTDEGGKYPECTSFRFNEFGRPTDQGGFGTFVRYDYEAQIQALPCSEANGFPEDPSECKGKFIRHMWSGKDTLIKIVTGHQFPGRFLPVIHSMAKKDRDNFYFAKKDLS